MASISSKAAGSLENRKKYNGIEYDDDLDIDEYEAFYRNLDPQTGRWWEIDPKCEASINLYVADDDGDATTPEGLESISPYASMNDNPALHSDPLGDMPGCCQLALQILQTTEMLQDQIIIAGGGAADPVTDAAAVVIDVLGLASAGLSALWEWTTQSPAASPPKVISVPKAIVPVENPVITQVQVKKGPKDLVAEAKAKQQKEAEAAARAAKKQIATAKGKTQIGKSNQGTRGSHNSGSKKPDKHDPAEARRAREQNAADAAKKAAKKKN